MNRLTTAGRLMITALVLALIYFGLKYVAGVDLIQKFKAGNKTEQTDTSSPTLPSGEQSVAVEEGTGGSEASTDEASSGSPQAGRQSGTRAAFNFQAPEPQGGKLKGVVELGASGFNSFIVRVDDQKRWKLEKADFGNSLVLENMATDLDIRAGLKQYIANMLNFGVNGREIQFVVSSGALKAETTQKIIKNLKALNYVVNTVTPEQEGRLALRAALPAEFDDNSFVVDIGSGNTKISWKNAGNVTAVETYGAKYFQNGDDDAKVYDEVKSKAKQVPADHRKTCFIIGGIPFELAKQVRVGKERYTVLKLPADYAGENAKQKAGINIYKGVADATGTQQFVFDWDANFTIGYLLSLK
ncbi:hypothetical protein [Fibrivirga algicola]|uniref:Ppx/GppA phosphatase domain-containing protein n=1 Tax=Fibrivirga algicola TaxID=2950420 RepID=A0ABX0QAN6_9BACT|nr:hypothetical protein [Fibrivirga algicola]ARK13096.1 hypothetical protein A6C57_23655 [Fibrella sp. ES10-3-2-2]NID09326.1 hypothetical protein [Fibrivirga algicola]